MANFQYRSAKESPNWLNMNVIKLGPRVPYSNKRTKLRYEPMAFPFVIRSPWCSSNIPQGLRKPLWDRLHIVTKLKVLSAAEHRVTVFSNWVNYVLLQSWGITCGCYKVEIFFFFNKKWCHGLLRGSNTRLLVTVRSLGSNLLHDVVYQRLRGMHLTWQVPPWVALADNLIFFFFLNLDSKYKARWLMECLPNILNMISIKDFLCDAVSVENIGVNDQHWFLSWVCCWCRTPIRIH